MFRSTPEPRDESTRTQGSSPLRSLPTMKLGSESHFKIAPPQSKPKAGKRQDLADLLKVKKPHSSSNPVQPNLQRSASAQSYLDKANTKWLEAPITKKYQQKEILDRQMPRVAHMASTSALFDLSKEESQNVQVAEACGLNLNGPILTCEAPAPTNTKLDTLKLHVKKKQKMSKRKISESAIKCLDAPYLTDDYYLNLLDWSSTDVLAVALEKSVYLWNTNNGTIEVLNYNSNLPITSLSFSADSALLAVGLDNGDTQIWDFQANKKLRSMANQGGGRANALSWNRHTVSAGYRDGNIFDHDVRVANHLVRELRGHESEVCGLKWRPDGEMLASGGNDNTVNIWDARNSKPKHTLRAHKGAVKAIAWCPWEKDLLATGGGRDDKHIFFWDVTRGTRKNNILTGSQVTSLHWSVHYKEITSTHGFPNNHISVWEYPTRNRIADFSAHDSRILHSALSPDGEVLATAAADENIKFWRLFDSEGNPRLCSSRSSRANTIRHNINNKTLR